MERRTYNPCDECPYGIDRRDGSGNDAMCRICEFNAYLKLGPIDHLRDLLQAEKDGRLVVLPCKVGDIVYQLDYMTHSEALKSGVPQSRDPHQNRKYARKRAEYRPLIVREKKMAKSLFREFGKTVFLTRAEAEAALAQMEAHNE